MSREKQIMNFIYQAVQDGWTIRKLEGSIHTYELIKPNHHIIRKIPTEAQIKNLLLPPLHRGV